MKQLHTNGVVVITKDISWVWVANGSNKQITIVGQFEKPEGGTTNIKMTIHKVLAPNNERKHWLLSGKISEQKLITIHFLENEQQARYILTDAPVQKNTTKNPFEGTVFDDIWPFK